MARRLNAAWLVFETVEGALMEHKSLFRNPILDADSDTVFPSQ
jgi:hypothetical protein